MSTPNNNQQMSDLSKRNHHNDKSSTSSTDGMITIDRSNNNGTTNNHSMTSASGGNNINHCHHQDEEIIKKIAARGFVHTYRPLEWLTAIAVTLLGFIVGQEAMPYCREFKWDDATISNEYKVNTFPVYSLVLTCVIGFFGVAMFIVLRPQSAFSSAYTASSAAVESALTTVRRGEINAVLLFAVHSLMINELVTGFIKVYDGRLRPDFISRLHMEGYSSVNTTVDFCELTKTSHLIHDGRLSFPSGHSSTSFMCCTSLSLYFISRLRAWSANNQSSQHHANGGSNVAGCCPTWFPKNATIRFLLGALPMILCIAIAVSRTRDNRHHHADILAGSIIGFMSAVLSWKMHFISVSEAKMHMLVFAAPSSIANNSNSNSGYNTTSASNNNDDVVSNATSNGGLGNLPWFLREENKENVGDHIPRWFL